MKTPDYKHALNPWTPLAFQDGEQAINIEEKIVRFRLPTIIEKEDNKWKRGLTTRQKRRYILVEQSAVITKYHKEK